MIRAKSIVPSIPVVDLSGPDGNAIVLLGMAKRIGIQLDLPVDSIRQEMMSGDYENLVTVFDRYFGDHVILER